MRRAAPDELQARAFPVMTARMSEAELGEWFPVSFDEINDPWAAPEPSPARGPSPRPEPGLAGAPHIAAASTSDGPSRAAPGRRTATPAGVTRSSRARTGMFTAAG